MKIYIASSWKNVAAVRKAAKILRYRHRHSVDDFTDPSHGRFVFSYTEIDNYQHMDGIKFLKQPKAQRAFQEDKKWIDWADVVLLMLPSGRSAHLEAGYAAGRGKKLIIYGDFPAGEFDVMYGFADLCTRELGIVLSQIDKWEDEQS